MTEKKAVENKQLIYDLPYHIDEYFNLHPEIKDGVKAGFRVYMRGKVYQNSLSDFDKHLEEYFKRKIK